MYKFMYLYTHVHTYTHINNYTAMLHTLPDYDTWCIYDFIILVYLKNVP